MKTVVLQSFRTHDVPAWMSRCLTSVRAWAGRRGYEYQFVDDRIFDLCGPEYLARVGDNKQSITNLARLELARAALRNGYDRAVWLDADVLVFAPDQLSIDVTAGYAFCKEAWISVDTAGRIRCQRGVNNAAFVFTKDEPDLDFLISTIRHVVAHRHITSNYQVGVWLLTGLERTLNYGLLRTIGMLSPDVVRAIVDDNVAVLVAQTVAFGDPISAANLCWSLAPETPERIITAAMDTLDATRGNVLNRYLPPRSGNPPTGAWSASPPLVLPPASGARTNPRS